MSSNVNKLIDPSICSCFPNSYRYNIFSKIKWSTLSLGTALLIIIVYLSSGLHALIDVTSMTSSQSHNSEGVLWTIASSSSMIIFGWILVSIYFIVVLLIIILLCGIQLEKAWLLFLWSILMIFMLLADGIVTIFSLREHQHQNRPLKEIKILFFVMIVRLIVSLCGIFVTVFHFRRLNKIQSDQLHQQKMLNRFNAESPMSSSYHDSSDRSVAMLNPTKFSDNDRYSTEMIPSVSLPRAKFSTMQQQQGPTIFHTYNHQSEYIMHSYRKAINKYNNDFRYNVPLQERFHEQEIRGLQNI
ncbi:unnamed protein product [Adineta steineri]|uniref:Uncharacterized protein n=1 Tax=Adineta steineri TaxID=433720 RepID=A0A814J4Y8_9BILA|nr:unnamed protein product [Adineta steineri]CAF1101812.1 unnamed protein product [Adineta steineri]